jgi:NADH dehydrogenase
MLMMPGLARRLRLVTDWTVGLFFGRAAAELGQLGHPPRLADTEERATETPEPRT